MHIYKYERDTKASTLNPQQSMTPRTPHQVNGRTNKKTISGELKNQQQKLMGGGCGRVVLCKRLRRSIGPFDMPNQGPFQKVIPGEVKA